MITAAILVIFPLCLAVSACSDMLTMTIPNRVSLLLMVSFPVVAVFAGLPWNDIFLHFAAGLTVFVVVFALFALNVMGGGDAKLLATSAIWFGFNPSLTEYLIYVSILGGFLTISILSLRSYADTILGLGIPVPTPLLMAKKVPYGIAIGFAGILVFPSSPLMQLVLHSH